MSRSVVMTARGYKGTRFRKPRNRKEEFRYFWGFEKVTRGEDVEVAAYIRTEDPDLMVIVPRNADKPPRVLPRWWPDDLFNVRTPLTLEAEAEAEEAAARAGTKLYKPWLVAMGLVVKGEGESTSDSGIVDLPGGVLEVWGP